MRFTMFIIKSCAAIAVLMVAMLAVSTASAQAVTAATSYGLDRGQVPAMEIGFDYSYFHANAPPNQCGCFGMNGGGGSLLINLPHGFGVVADLTGAHTNSVNGSTETLTILNVLGGVRYSYHTHSRFTPYVEALAGRSLEYSNVPFASDRSAFAASGGGGVSRSFGRYVSWQMVQAEYVYSQLPNAHNNDQNNLRVSTGIVFRLAPE